MTSTVSFDIEAAPTWIPIAHEWVPSAGRVVRRRGQAMADKAVAWAEARRMCEALGRAGGAFSVERAS